MIDLSTDRSIDRSIDRDDSFSSVFFSQISLLLLAHTDASFFSLFWHIYRWLRSGLSVQGTPPPEGVETRLQEQQQQLQQQFMILQPDGSLAVAPQHQAAYKDAAAVVATRAQEFARWETKQGALEQQVQSALAHAAVSLRPVRADARWS